MAEKHPYVVAQGHLVQVIKHFRRSFPSTVTAETLRKLGFARQNESYVLNVLRFLGLIDQEGSRTDLASRVFSLRDDSAFHQEFGKIASQAYNDLFELHGDNTWGLDTGALITFFRQADATTEIVGKLQASTFRLLAAFSGHGEVPEPKAASAKSPSTAKKKPQRPGTTASETPPVPSGDTRLNKGLDAIGLTVRIEINLPADGEQETYDRIFRSIRENLLGG